MTKSWILFRHKGFQIEFLYIPRDAITPPHTHPGMNKKILYLFGTSVFRKIRSGIQEDAIAVNFFSSFLSLFTVRSTEPHWADPPSRGVGIIIFERWTGEVKTELTDLNIYA